MKMTQKKIYIRITSFDLFLLVNNPNLKSLSKYANRGLKFFILHPKALDIFLSNLENASLTRLSQLLIENQITNYGKAYSIPSISYYKIFLLDVIKYYAEKKTGGEEEGGYVNTSPPNSSSLQINPYYTYNSPLNPDKFEMNNNKTSNKEETRESHNLFVNIKSHESYIPGGLGFKRDYSTNLDFSKWPRINKKKYIYPLAMDTITSSSYQSFFFTFDIETYNFNGKAIPYLIGLYSNSGYKDFYGENCIKIFIEYVISLKIDKKKITFYAHNAGNFDNYLLLHTLLELNICSDINYLEDKNNSIFYLYFKYNDILFEFKDSYKFIPVSLNQLLTDFNYQNENKLKGKLPFNHSWVNKNNLNYEGEIPFWLHNHNDILKELGCLENDIFRFKKYSVKYNEVDTKGLYYILDIFFKFFVNKYQIDFGDCLTLPQLTLSLFRKKYLNPKNKIKLLSKRMQNIFSMAYFGGNTSLYLPKGSNIYVYDINSLYPFCMLKKLPVGTPKSYDTSKGLSNFFGFALAKIYAPESLNLPFLPTYGKINGKTTLIFPTGVFKGYYFSEELKYALTLGYKIDLLQAWEMESDDTLFKDFVPELYNLKKNGKTKAEQLIFKLLLNSLYGRMGRHSEYNKNVISKDMNFIESLEKKYSNLKPLPLKNGYVSITYNLAPNPNLIDINNVLFDELKNIYDYHIDSTIANLAIAAAISAWSRIEAVKYKRIKGVICYYSDTDSFYLDKPLPTKYLGDEIGKLKNELQDENYNIENDSDYYIKEAYFLGDKRYILKTFKDEIIIKFAGLHKNQLPSNFYELFKERYETNNKNPIEILIKEITKNNSTFEINHKEINKLFTFDYFRRIPIYDSNGVWISTVPLHIPYIKAKNTDLTYLIGRQNRIIHEKNNIGLKNYVVNINHYNVYTSYYKHFDGYFLNFFKSIPKDIPSGPSYTFIHIKSILLMILSELIDKAIEEEILVKDIGFVISEEYINKRGESHIKTISYLQSFNSIQELLNIYEQHLIGLIESEQLSGDKIKEISLNKYVKESYNIKTLYLRILIPKYLITENKVPARFLLLNA